MPFKEKIPEPLVGERLDRVVSMIASCTRSQAVELIGDGKVALSGKIAASKSQRVQMNQEVMIDWSPPLAQAPPAGDESVAFTTVFEDDHILVIDKPAGLVVHPGSGNESGTLVNGLIARYPDIVGVGQVDRPGIVHRLDKDTSGLMLVARTQQSYEASVEMLSEHRVGRVYTALVHDRVEADRGTIDAPIARSFTHSTQMAINSSGRDAVTHYRVLQRFDSPAAMSLLQLQLETGRTHQIRVHLRSIGHPVVADRVYSRRSPFGLERMFLHSSSIIFVHPIDGRSMEFSVDLPTVLGEFLLGLNEYGEPV